VPTNKPSSGVKNRSRRCRGKGKELSPKNRNRFPVGTDYSSRPKTSAPGHIVGEARDKGKIKAAEEGGGKTAAFPALRRNKKISKPYWSKPVEQDEEEATENVYQRLPEYPAKKGGKRLEKRSDGN